MFKSKFLLLAIAVTAACSLPAFATDGTITFNGLVTATTCTINVNGSGTRNATVTLPTVSTSALPSNGSVAGRTPFTIALSGCAPASGTVATYFEPSATLNTLQGTLLNQAGGGAINVDIQLLNSTFGVIDLRQNAGAQNDVPKSIASGSATLKYYAQYYATGTATSGAVTSNTTYSIIYQ